MMLLTVALLLAWAPQEKTRYVLEVPQGDTVVFEFPKDWTIQKSQTRPGLPPTLKLTPPDPSAMSLQITMIPDKDGKLATLDALKKTLERSTRQFLPGAVEKTFTIVDLESKAGRGCHGTITDASLVDAKAVPEGQFLKMTSGMFGVGKNVATFTILANAGGEALQKQALDVIAGAALGK